MAGLGTFRAKALLKLQSPDQLDERVQVVAPSTWLALLGLGIFIAGVFLWASVSRLPTTVSGSGYVVPQAGWTDVETAGSGVVQSIVAENAHVAAGQRVAVVLGADGKRTVVTAATSGTVTESSAAVGQYVEAGAQLAIVVPTGKAVIVYAYFSVATAKSLAPRAGGKVSLEGTPTSAFGYVRGTITNVGTLPVTRSRVERVLLNPTLADRVLAHGPVVEVLITLDRSRTPSGYSWTVGRGPSFDPVTGGATVRVEVDVASRHPISYVV